MILQRLKTLWRLSAMSEERFEPILRQIDKVLKQFKEEEGLFATVVPYKKRNPVAELIAQLPENQKEI